MKRITFLCMIFLCMAGMNGQGLAEHTEDSMEKQIEEVMESLDFSVLDGVLIDLPNDKGMVSVKEATKQFARGVTIDPSDVLSDVFQMVLSEVGKLSKLMAALMLPAILISLVSGVLMTRKEVLAPNARLACMILILIPMVICTMQELTHTKTTIVEMTRRMDGMLPMLLSLLTAIGGNASSAFLHPVVISASGIMAYLAREVVLRMVMYTCAVTAVDHLSERGFLTRMARLLRNGVSWLLSVSFTIFIGAMSLQGACCASIDGVTIRVAKYAADSFMPVVGGMFSDTMDMLVGGSLIVKNAMGITATLLLAGAIGMPMVRTLAVSVMMKFCAALLEPIAEEGIVRAMEEFSQIIVLCMVTMICVGTMYFLMIVQLLLVGNLTVMLR